MLACSGAAPSWAAALPHPPNHSSPYSFRNLPTPAKAVVRPADAGNTKIVNGYSPARRVAPPSRSARAQAKVDYRRACAAARAGHAACMSLIRTDVRQHRQPAVRPDTAPVGVGYGPASLQSAYLLPSGTAGSGQTVAIVDAYDDPNAASDLAAYRSAWGLPACGSGCFSVVNQNGAASPLPAAAGTSGWDLEESLDVDMVSAICPLCHIILVEASSTTLSDLGTAVNAAVSLGAKFVSNSYGVPDFSSEASYDASYYNHPGVAITASAGDGGYGVEYPAASQYVTAVGGTSLTTASNARGWTETAWGSSAGGSGTGSGCSGFEAKPSWQADTGCTNRTNSDVAADADPDTGVAVYDTYSQGGWLEVGGTSASSPMIASVFALAGTPAASTYPSSYIYQHTASLFDVTSGADGSCSPAYLCTAQAGYDGPTGWGTPDGTAAFNAEPVVGNTEILNGYGFPSDLCLDARSDPPFSANNDGDTVWLWTCNGTVQQQWSINTTLGSYGTITDAYGDHLCLDARSDPPFSPANDGDPVFLWTCNGSDQQQWEPVVLSDGSYAFVNESAGTVLSAENDSGGNPSQNGDNVQVNSSNGGSQQQWNF